MLVLMLGLRFIITAVLCWDSMVCSVVKRVLLGIRSMLLLLMFRDGWSMMPLGLITCWIMMLTLGIRSVLLCLHNNGLVLWPLCLNACWEMVTLERLVTLSTFVMLFFGLVCIRTTFALSTTLRKTTIICWRHFRIKRKFNNNTKTSGQKIAELKGFLWWCYYYWRCTGLLFILCLLWKEEI